MSIGRRAAIFTFLGIISLSQQSFSLVCSDIFENKLPEIVTASSALQALSSFYRNSYGSKWSDAQIQDAIVLSDYSIRELERGLHETSNSQRITSDIETLTRVLSNDSLNSHAAVESLRQRVIRLAEVADSSGQRVQSVRIENFKNLFAEKSQESTKSSAPGFFRRFWSKITEGKHSIKSLHAKNPFISAAQLQYILRKRPNLFNDSSELPTLAPVTQAHLKGARIGEMSVRPLLELEHQLLQDSNLNTNPREVMRIVLIDWQGGQRVSSAIIGSADSIDGMTAKETLKILSAYGLADISQIVITHTHPATNIVINGRSLYLTPLSNNDLDLAATISKSLPGIVLSIRAVVPNGFAYESQFYNGSYIHE